MSFATWTDPHSPVTMSRKYNNAILVPQYYTLLNYKSHVRYNILLAGSKVWCSVHFANHFTSYFALWTFREILQACISLGGTLVPCNQFLRHILFLWPCRVLWGSQYTVYTGVCLRSQQVIFTSPSDYMRTDKSHNLFFIYVHVVP